MWWNREYNWKLQAASNLRIESSSSNVKKQENCGWLIFTSEKHLHFSPSALFISFVYLVRLKNEINIALAH
jgi:hypothetical protein